MSYQLTHVFVGQLGLVFYVVWREQQIVLIVFLRQQLNCDIVNVAVKYKGEMN
jgi:hypothetical protein